MAARMRFMVPQGTTNYIKNPSARYDTTDINASGAAVTRVLTHARFGIASYQVVTNGAALNEGFYYRISALNGISDVLTVSAFVRGAGVVRIRLIDNPAGKEWSSIDHVLRSDRWERIEVSGRCTGSNDMRLYVETAGDAAQSITFYVDGLQMERYEEATSYCDGDQEGCFWTGMEHASTSTRDDYTRAGGRWIDVAGPSCEKKNLYMTVAGGLGAAPIMNQIQPYADAPGSYFQDFKIVDRVITLTFFAKREYRPRSNTLPSLEALHQLRQQLIDLVKPDRTADRKPFWMEYKDGDKAMYLQVRYEAGLEGEWDVRNHFVNSFPLRLLAVSPLFYEDDQEVSSLSLRERQTINYIVRRFDGEWGAMNGGFDDQVRALAVGSRGEIIAVGDFTHANNDIGAIDPMIFGNCVAYWDGEKWNQYGAGADDIIYDVDVAPNGDVYVVGAFTNIGGVAANRVAYWDGSWHALGAGLNDEGYAIRVGPDGDVYVGGKFTLAGGVADTVHVARWDSSWHALETGVDDDVYALEISDDGDSVFLGGAFTENIAATSTLNKVAVYYPSLATLTSLDNGLNDTVRRLRLSKTGTLYAVGDFTADADDAVIMLYVASWNGAVWSAVGVGGNNTVRDIALSSKSSFVVAGDFVEMGSEDALYAALWNGSDYVLMDIEVDNPCYAVAYDKKDNIYLAPNGTLASWARLTTVENIGTTEATPKIYIKGPCTLIWIENQTTKKRVYANLDILTDEEVFIDFGLGTVESAVRGNLAYAIHPGSDFRAWKLSPGDNDIAVLVTDDTDAVMQISYIPRHWSVDASPAIEEL